MLLKLELFGAVSERFPQGEGERSFEDGVTPEEIVAWLDLKDGDQFVVLVNGQPVATEDRDRPVLTEGDLVTVFPPMEGG